MVLIRTVLFGFFAGAVYGCVRLVVYVGLVFCSLLYCILLVILVVTCWLDYVLVTGCCL